MAKVPPQLTPLKGKGDKYSDEVRKKLKGSSSKKRKIAQRIRRIREMSPKDIEEKALQLVANPDASALEIMRIIQILINKPNVTPKRIGELVDKLIRAHVAIHGTKSKNINLNIDMTADKVLERIKTYKIVGVKEKKKRDKDEAIL